MSVAQIVQTPEEIALPYREQRLVRALMRLGAELAFVIDGQGLLVAATESTHDLETLAAVAVHPSTSDRFGPYGKPTALSFTLGPRTLDVRPIELLDLQLVTFGRQPIDPARRDRVARELRLLLAE